MSVAPPPSLAASFTLTAGLLISAALGVAFHLLAARSLEPAGYGAFAAALTYATLWSIVMEAGISVAFTREAAADRARLGWLPRLVRWKIGLGVAGGAGAVASGLLLGAGRDVAWLIGILALGMVGASGLRLAFAVFRVAGAFRREAIVSSVQKVALVLFAAGAIALHAGTTGVAVAMLLSYWIAAAMALSRARADVAGSPPGAPPRRFLLRVCVPLFAVELLTGVYFKVDQVILLGLKGAEETGLYAAAYRVIEALLLAVAGSMGVLFLRLASARDDADTFGAHVRRAWLGLWLAGLGLAVNGWLWAADLLSLVLGAAYVPAQAPLAILLGAVPLAYVNYLLTQSLIARGRERFYAAGTAVCAAVNVGLNLVLIPEAGAIGAAWASVATEATLSAICLVGLGRVVRSIPLAPTLIAAAVAALAVWAGWTLLAERPQSAAILGAVVSLGLWETLSPWPLRQLAARAAGRRPDSLWRSGLQ